MILYYTSSNGQTFDLKVGHIRTRTADFHNYSWDPQTVSQQYGERPYRFDKNAQAYSVQVSIFGTMEEKRTYLNMLHAAFEHDIINHTPGRITHGEYYIDCYVTASNTFYENPFIYNDLVVYCPKPFWTKEKTYHLHGEEASEYEYLDYNYGYQYDYAAKLPGYVVLANLGEISADFKLVIYGPAINPSLIIGNMPVGANVSISAAERIEISSADKTVIQRGVIDKNIFNYRLKSRSMFERIPSGEHPVLWSGTFDADLTLYEERSEPLWI